MPTLAALAFVTPIFGFSLTPPGLGPQGAVPPSGPSLMVPAFLQAAPDGAEASGADGETEGESSEGESSEGGETGEEDTSDNGSSGDDYAEQLRMRQDIGTVHRALGIATWGSMLATVVLGFFQYYNQYGFFGSREDTPCVSGGAIFGQDQCWGEPWPHRIAAMTTTALYTATFTLSFLMPDPNNLEEQDSDYANTLRIHKALRWAHLVGMVAQVFMGFMVGQNWFGLDRANNFDELQAIATVHNLVGLTTFGLLTAAGAIMLF